MKNWYSIRNVAAQPAAEIDIFDEIGVWGVTVKDFAASLAAVPQDRDILLRINSPGGSVFDGFAIFDLLKSRNVTARVVGVAASMATVIMLAARRIEAAENAVLMIHNPVGLSFGDAEQMRSDADLIDKLKGRLVAVYAKKTGKSEKDVSEAMDKTTWFTAQEAKDWGLVDAVTEPVKVAAVFDVARLNPPQGLFSGALPASTNHQPKDTMKNLMKALVEAKLIASIDASDEVAASQFQAAFSAHADARKDAETKLATAEASLKSANAKLQDAAKASAEVLVSEAVKAGKIKDAADIRAKWVEALLRDESGTKAMIESLADQKAPRGAAPVASGRKADGAKNVPSTESVWAKQFSNN